MSIDIRVFAVVVGLTLIGSSIVTSAVMRYESPNDKLIRECRERENVNVCKIEIKAVPVRKPLLPPPSNQ